MKKNSNNLNREYGLHPASNLETYTDINPNEIESGRDNSLNDSVEKLSSPPRDD